MHITRLGRKYCQRHSLGRPHLARRKSHCLLRHKFQSSGPADRIGRRQGEGAELRSDQAVAVRARQGTLLEASGKFQGIFKQTGYEHQASYSDQNALHSTLYSIVQIARTMKWSK